MAISRGDASCFFRASNDDATLLMALSVGGVGRHMIVVAFAVGQKLFATEILCSDLKSIDATATILGGLEVAGGIST